MQNYVVLVDKNDEELGLADKIEAHTTKPQLHRAITVLLFNDKNEILITKRSKGKLVWPLIWETTCSTHPFENESYEECAKRRLKEELGIDVTTKVVDKIIYSSKDGDRGSENEVCALLIGEINQSVSVNPAEIAETKFIVLDQLRKDVKKNPQEYASWLVLSLESLERLNISKV